MSILVKWLGAISLVLGGTLVLAYATKGPSVSRGVSPPAVGEGCRGLVRGHDPFLSFMLVDALGNVIAWDTSKERITDLLYELKDKHPGDPFALVAVLERTDR